MLKKQNILFPFCLFFQIGSSIACGSGVKLSKFYYYDDVTDSCQAEIACPVPIEDTSRGNRFFSRISCLKLCKKPNQVKTKNWVEYNNTYAIWIWAGYFFKNTQSHRNDIPLRLPKDWKKYPAHIQMAKSDNSNHSRFPSQRFFFCRLLTQDIELACSPEPAKIKEETTRV